VFCNDTIDQLSHAKDSRAKMSKLFDCNDNYTAEGSQIAREIESAFREIYERHSQYSAREMNSIAHHSVTLVTSHTILTKNVKRWQESKIR
jgi:hypothetical protein